MPEVIKDGITGFIINSSDSNIRGKWIIKKTGIQGMMEAVQKIYSMSEEEYKKMRINSRKHVEDNFAPDRMVNDYLAVYEKVIKK